MASSAIFLSGLVDAEQACTLRPMEAELKGVSMNILMAQADLQLPDHLAQHPERGRQGVGFITFSGVTTQMVSQTDKIDGDTCAIYREEADNDALSSGGEMYTSYCAPSG